MPYSTVTMQHVIKPDLYQEKMVTQNNSVFKKKKKAVNRVAMVFVLILM